MKLYATVHAARENGDSPLFIPKVCPYSGMASEEERICGNWCPHFRLVSSGKTILLTCGGQECMYPVIKEQ